MNSLFHRTLRHLYGYFRIGGYFLTEGLILLGANLYVGFKRKTSFTVESILLLDVAML